jgi:hypothetical protein
MRASCSPGESMRLILFAAAVWSIGIGLRRAIQLRSRDTATWTSDTLADWVSALSLIGAGLWAWESQSWLALVGGYAIGWAVLFVLPVPRQTHAQAALPSVHRR